jgi:hypothetical protein
MRSRRLRASRLDRRRGLPADHSLFIALRMPWIGGSEAPLEGDVPAAVDTGETR